MSQLPVLNATPAEAPPKRTLAPRRQTRQIRLGDVLIGGGAPITVQSMTKTETADVEATLNRYPEVYQDAADSRVPIWEKRHPHGQHG